MVPMPTRFFRCLGWGLALSALLVAPAHAQDDLDKLLDAGETPAKKFAEATFKSTRIVNLQSVEKAAPGELEFVISHRFGPLNGGALQLWGLDQSTIRLGLQYGLTDWLSVGVGRSSYQKTYDAFAKVRLLRQATGPGGQPLSVVYFASIAAIGQPWDDPTRRNYFSSRLSYVHQLLIASKLSDRLSLELAPTLVHRNLVAAEIDPNNQYALGVGGRFKLTRRLALNGEYIYRLPPQHRDAPGYAPYHNSLSAGFDIETGGHVFQLHVTNSLLMMEKGFIGETTDSWGKGGIHFGFNITRNFSFHRKPRG